jgi:hypothetical protein
LFRKFGILEQFSVKPLALGIISGFPGLVGSICTVLGNPRGWLDSLRYGRGLADRLLAASQGEKQGHYNEEKKEMYFHGPLIGKREGMSIQKGLDSLIKWSRPYTLGRWY